VRTLRGRAGSEEGAVVTEHDEELRPLTFPGETTRGWAPPEEARRVRREQRISDHVERHRARGARPPVRGRGLSREEIVAAAIAVADAEGPDAISMRRIARDLRAGAMSLYWHVASKEELIQAMLDSLEAEIGVPEPTGDWRADLWSTAHRLRAGLLRHPWVMEYAANRPPTGPNDMRNLELMLGMVDGLGLDARTMVDILMTVNTYVLGAVLREVQEIRTERARVEREAAMTAAEIDAQRERFWSWLANTDEFPQMHRMVEAQVDPDSPDTRDERFDFGLDCLLDGIGARLPTRPAS
jgi:AcrR family transcriptional regulator